MRNTEHNGGFSVSRILRVSPEQNEMSRRNYSRIFIVPTGEGFIDSVLFQKHRPLEGYMDVAERAIALAGLKDISGVNGLRAIHSSVGAGFLQGHIATVGWLEADDTTIYDLIVEVIPEGEQLPEIDFPTSNASMVEDYLDNPVIISAEKKDLAHIWSLSGDLDIGSARSPEAETQDEQANASENQTVDASSSAGQRGRVIRDDDKRLKKNRPGNGSAMARQAAPSDGDRTGDAGRMAGKPGRVRHSIFDGRLKANRRGSTQSQTGAAESVAGGR